MHKENISKKLKDWKLLEFVAPITESVFEDDDFIIRGIAINETTTLNNVKYVAEELEKAAPSFRDVPILLDHENSVKNIVGRTTENVNFNFNEKRIDFEAKIRDKDIQEMIKDGRLKSVSIGARVEDLTEEEDGSMKALGVQGMEISFVACAGDQGATFGQALHSSFILKEMANKVDNKLDNKASDINQLNKMENKQMAEEEKTDTVKPEAEVEASEEKPEAEAEETVEEPAKDKEEVATEKAKSGIVSEMRAEINEMRQLLVEKRKLREEIEAEPEVETPAAEEPAAEEPKEEAKDETKGDVSDAPEEAEETSEGFVVERAGAGKFTVYRDYAKESQDSKLKRLIR